MTVTIKCSAGGTHPTYTSKALCNAGNPAEMCDDQKRKRGVARIIAMLGFKRN